MDAMKTFSETINNLPTTIASFGDEAPEVVSVSREAVLAIVNKSFNALSQMSTELTNRAHDLSIALADRINKCTSMEQAMEGCKELSSRLQADAGKNLEQANQTIRQLTHQLSTSDAALEGARAQLAALPARILKLGERGLLIGGIGAGAVVAGSLGHRCVHEDSTYKKAFFSLVSFAGFAAMCFVLFNRPLSTAAQALSQWSFTK